MCEPECEAYSAKPVWNEDSESEFKALNYCPKRSLTGLLVLFKINRASLIKEEGTPALMKKWG